MDRREFFYDQQVTDPELDGAFAAAEAADLAIVSDDGISGVRSGLGVVEHSTPADLTVDVAAGIAYDPSGRRMRVPTLQVVNCALDSNGVSTAVVNGGNSKIVGIFLKFARALSDDRTDGNGNPIKFVQNESFEIVRVQGAEAGSPTAPATPSDTIRLCDVTRTFAQTQILNAQISTTNRKFAFDATAGSLVLHKGTTPEAIQDLLTQLNGHVTGASAKHPASAIDYAGGGAWADATTNPAATVEVTLDSIFTSLAGTAGAAKIGAAALSAWKDGTTNPAAAIQTQLAKFITDLIADAGGSRIGIDARTPWLGGRTNPAGISVRAAIDKIITDLLANTGGDDGAERIGASGTGNFSAGSVRSQLDDLDLRTNWSSTTLADASTTLTVASLEYRLSIAMSANRTITLNNPALDGRRVRFVQMALDGSAAGTITVRRADTVVLFTISVAGQQASGSPCFAELISVGGVWKLSAIGQAKADQASVFSAIINEA